MTAFWSFFKKLSIILILTIGCLTLLVRISGPFIDNARDSIAMWLSTKVGMKVNIENIDTNWVGMSPEIILNEITLGENINPFSIKKIIIDLKPTELFTSNPENIFRTTFHGMNIFIIKNKNNEFKISNIGNSYNKKYKNKENIFPANLRIRNTKLNFKDETIDYPPITFDNISIDFKINKNQFLLNSEMKSKSGKYIIIAKGNNKKDPLGWYIKSYLKADLKNIPSFFYEYIPAKYKLVSEEVDFEIWQEWKKFIPVNSIGTINFLNIEFPPKKISSNQYRFKKIKSEFQLSQAEKDKWLLQLEKLSILDSKGLSLKNKKMALYGNFQNKNKKFSIFIDKISIKNAKKILAKTDFITKNIKNLIKKIKPEGELRELKFLRSVSNPSWKLSGNFKNLSIEGSNNIPSISNLSGNISSKNNIYKILINSNDLNFQFDNLFRKKIQIKKLSGLITAILHKNNWDVSSKELVIDTNDIKSISSFKIIKKPKEKAFLKLMSKFSDGKIKSTHKYLPVSLMKEKLISWLDNSLIEGKINEGFLLINGPLHHFPFKKLNNGSFEVNVKVEDAALNYRKDWPILTNVDANIFFAQNSMEIDLIEGKIKDNKIHSLKAKIPSLYPTFPLEIEGSIKGPLEKQLDLLKNGVLGQRFGNIANTFDVKGDSSLFLDFKIPLSLIGKPHLDGILQFNGSRVSLPDWDISIEKVAGKLMIGLNSIETENIEGIFLGSPLTISIYPKSEKFTSIKSKFSLSSASIEKKYPEISGNFLKGRGNFNFSLDIPNAKTDPRKPAFAEISSNLVGLKINLPHPLGKTKTQTRIFKIRLPIGGNKKKTEINYDNKLNIFFSRNLKNIEARYQSNTKKISKAGYNLLANLDFIDMNSWQNIFKKFKKNNAYDKNWSINIKSKKMVINKFTLNDTNLEINKNKNLLSGNINSEEIEGIFNYRVKDNLIINLKKLYLYYDAEKKYIQQTKKELNSVDPLLFPKTTFMCKDLKINQADFGKAKVILIPKKTGLDISELTLNGSDVNIEGTGSWFWDKGNQKTKFVGSLKTQKLGDLLKKIGYPRHMHKASAKLSFNLLWPGNPTQGSKNTLKGNLNLNIGSGRLANVKPGITRVIGLLSVDALTRWLKLDFADLLKKGYSFDTINGDFIFDKGNAQTNNLIIDGPSSRIEVGGKIGLINRDFDQLVSVTPKLDTTVTLASALAGGPVAGVAALLAQELLTDKVDQINRFEYSVKGTWNKPELIPLDSGGGLSRIVNKLSGKKIKSKTSEQEEMIERSESETKGPIRRLFNTLPKTKEKPLKSNTSNRNKNP